MIRFYLGLAFVIGLGLSHAFSYYRGYSSAVAAEESKTLREGFDALKQSIEKASVVQEKMIDVSQELVDKTSKLHNNTVVIREAQKANARANPLDPSCTVNGRTVELRNEQIDEIYRAIGLELPPERKGRLPSS